MPRLLEALRGLFELHGSGVCGRRGVDSVDGECVGFDQLAFGLGSLGPRVLVRCGHNLGDLFARHGSYTSCRARPPIIGNMLIISEGL